MHGRDEAEPLWGRLSGRQDSTEHSPSSYCPTSEKQLQQGENEEKMGKEGVSSEISAIQYLGLCGTYCRSLFIYFRIIINWRKLKGFLSYTKETLVSDLNRSVVKVRTCTLARKQKLRLCENIVFFSCSLGSHESDLKRDHTRRIPGQICHMFLGTTEKDF